MTPPPLPGPYPPCNKLPASDEEGEEDEEEEERKAGCAAAAGESINEEEEEEQEVGVSMNTARLISPLPPHSCSVVESRV